MDCDCSARELCFGDRAGDEEDDDEEGGEGERERTGEVELEEAGERIGDEKGDFPGKGAARRGRGGSGHSRSIYTMGFGALSRAACGEDELVDELGAAEGITEPTGEPGLWAGKRVL